MPTYPIEFSSSSPRTERLVLNRRQSASESPHTYAVQVVNTASQWVLEWTWPPLRLAEAETVMAWLISLRGQIGTFRYRPRQSRTSTLTGRTLAAVGFAYNAAISVGGWGAGAASQLRPGQFFQVGDQLLRIVEAPTNADGSGRVTISFEPELRRNMASGSPVNFVNPAGLFRLASSEGAGFTLDPDRHPDIGTVMAREVTV